ncbi:MAG TPA: preprotein translocase subunit YajC [Stellaceae bacterium]|nr:preprotein translocase subunit YajC [Stellaceae bacterium]
MLISTAYAQGAGGMFDQSALIQFLPLVLIFVVFYFLLIRPQQQKQKQQRSMLDALRRGDRVVTGGGILGTVNRVTPGSDEIEVDIASNVRVRVLRSTISTVLTKPDPAAAREAANESAAPRGAGRRRARDTARDAKEAEPAKGPEVKEDEKA